MPGYAPLTDDRLWLPRGTTQAAPRPGGEFVLYWMQVTHRAHDNFALNHAIEQANALGVPVLVYHGLRHDYPWASDRLHTFILQGVRDLVAAFAARGIQYAFYLDDRDPGETGERPSPLVALAERAALVVTDWFPTFIMPRQLKALRERVGVPVVAVDSALVIPAKRLTKSYSAARWIRPDLMGPLGDWLLPIETVEPEVRRPIDLPFAVTEPGEDIAALVAACDIDHNVPPARGWTGGTRAAQARLDWWLEHGLPRYLERNDPNVDVTSRMSPWLHFGHVSVHEVLLAAREAGPAEPWKKFLDETLTWRELAFNFCRFQPKHRTVEAIPDWARTELADHEDDPREAIYSDEQLERGETDDELWNACQQAYLRDGWMHNYLRMLWGKSVIGWTENAARALRILEHLNNKYALDGRDPNSYGGILWCFGRFDRPFFRRPIYGTVRYMSTNAARKKFDVPAYIRSMA
ncbi:MAG: deoxyribodipyrimidine photo-lyase [Gemmatimonadales bacterium]